MNDHLIWNEPLPSWDGSANLNPDAEFVFALSGGNTYNETGSGGVVVGGNKDIVVINEPSTGGVVLGGSATIQETVKVTATGGVVLGGTVVFGNNITDTGGFVIGGTSVIYLSDFPVSTSGTIIGGSATLTAKYKITATGGSVIGGATPFTNASVSTGGAIIGGTTAPSMVFDALAPKLDTGFAVLPPSGAQNRKLACRPNILSKQHAGLVSWWVSNYPGGPIVYDLIRGKHATLVATDPTFVWVPDPVRGGHVLVLDGASEKAVVN